MTPLQCVQAALRARGCRQQGRDYQCPAHEDKRASLSVSEAPDGRVLLYCHRGCSTEQVVAALGLRLADLFPSPKGNGYGDDPVVATYVYRDENGHELYEVQRTASKKFRQARIEPDGSRVCEPGCMRGVRRVLYRLPELQQAIDAGDTVFIVEGEKDADNLHKAGWPATCNPTGASKWREDYSGHFQNAPDVRVIADKDSAGYEHAQEVATSLRRVGASVRVFESPSGKDVSDLLTAGGSVEDLIEIDLEEQLRGLAAQAAHNQEGSARPSRHQTDRPSIVASNRQLDDLADDSVQALVAANDPPSLFIRSGSIVRVRRDEEDNPVVELIGETAVVEALSRAASFFRHNPNGVRFNAHPSKALAGIVIVRLTQMGDSLPPLRGITESPVVSQDGTILSQPGYDPQTRLVYMPAPGFELPAVPHALGGAQVEAAGSLIEEVIHDFPFVDKASEATAYAAALTLVVRELIPLAPAFLIDAPAPGTGKGLLSNVVSVIGRGRFAGKMSPPGDRGDAEWRKRITAALVEGCALCILDNVEQPIDSPALAALLTMETWTDRILGRSTNITVPNRSTWIITGNNLRLRGDLPRRCVWCRLDARVARPWTRDSGSFQHPDLTAWVSDHRGEILAALFTLVRAWIAAGRPKPKDDVPQLGGFEQWRNVIGGILRVAGIPGFLGNLPDLYDVADEDTPQWAAFLEAWSSAYGEGEVAVAELSQDIRADKQPSLRENLPGELIGALEKPESFGRRLGKALAKKEETRFLRSESPGTLRITRAGERKRAVLWRVLGEE